MDNNNQKNVIFHIDVNSAFLSWEAVYRVNVLGEKTDLRDIPSAVGGSRESRHGIILAKSQQAKKFGVVTGEPIVSAQKKCPALNIVPPNHALYLEYSEQFIFLLKKYAPVVEQYSIDEAFLDMTGTEKLYGSPIQFANRLKDEIRDTLGFTVNVGISSNMLLAKMASDFEKPDKVHTLFPEELKEKLWPLPVGDLFFVGSATEKKLKNLGIKTIGELANTDYEFIISHFKKHGEIIWNYAWGRDTGDIRKSHGTQKGYSHDITLPYDVEEPFLAKHYILSICEALGARIRRDKAFVNVISITLLDNDFNKVSKQISLNASTNITEKIYEYSCILFDKCWTKKPIRLISVRASKSSAQCYEQLNIFDTEKSKKLSRLDSAIDSIRNKYGDNAILRASFMDAPDKQLFNK